MANAHKYIKIWNDLLPDILLKVKNANETGSRQEYQLKQELFEAAGCRPSSGYNFRMDISDGLVPVKSGTSVARDLKIVLDQSQNFMDLAEGRNLTIRMGKDFCLEIIPSSF